MPPDNPRGNHVNTAQGAPKKRSRTWLVAALVVVVIAAAAIVVGVVHNSNNKSHPKAAVQPNCDPSGCALVSESLTAIQPTGFYGASCSGTYGSWFLKIMQEGKGTQLRAGYDLKWTFTKASPVARPSGTIVVRPTGSGGKQEVTLTLVKGKLSLKGTPKSGVPIAATGTLTVSVAGTPAFPTLKFVETGLSQDETALGFNSPFDVNGHPLNLLIRSVKVLVGC